MCAGTDAAIDGCPWSRCQLPGDTANGGRCNTTGCGHTFRRERFCQCAYLLKTCDMFSELARGYQAFFEERVDDGKQEMRVVSRTDKMVLVSLLGGACAVRVDHHDLAPALA